MIICKNLLKRQRKYVTYFYCKKFKKEITLPCDKNCPDFILVKNKAIKNKTNKQKQLEESRYSIFTNDFTKCFYCHRKAKENEKMDLHEVYGGSNRIRSIKNGLVVPLCRKCHKNEKIINQLRIDLQKEYEKIFSKGQFIQLIGKDYTIKKF